MQRINSGRGRKGILSGTAGLLFLAMGLIAAFLCALSPARATFIVSPPAADENLNENLFSWEGVFLNETDIQLPAIGGPSKLDWMVSNNDWMKFDPASVIEINSPASSSRSGFGRSGPERLRLLPNNAPGAPPDIVVAETAPALHPASADAYASAVLREGLAMRADIRALEEKIGRNISANEFYLTASTAIRDNPYLMDQSSDGARVSSAEAALADNMLYWLLEKIINAWSYTNMFLLIFVALTLSAITSIIRSKNRSS